jgi:hypothetical protein
MRARPRWPGSRSAIAVSAGSFDGLFHRFTGFSGALLDAAQQFVLFAFEVLEVIVGEIGPLLFEGAFDDVPVTFDFECCHMCVGLVGFDVVFE